MGLIAVQKYPIKVIRDFSSEGKSCIGDFSEEVFRKIDESLIPICDDKYLYWENGDNKHGCLMEKTDQEKIAQDLSKLMDAKVEKAKEITEVSLRSPLNLFLSIGIDTSNILGTLDALMLIVGHIFLVTITPSQRVLVSESFQQSIQTAIEQNYNLAQEKYSLIDQARTIEDLENL